MQARWNSPSLMKIYYKRGNICQQHNSSHGTLYLKFKPVIPAVAASNDISIVHVVQSMCSQWVQGIAPALSVSTRQARRVHMSIQVAQVPQLACR